MKDVDCEKRKKIIEKLILFEKKFRRMFKTASKMSREENRTVDKTTIGRKIAIKFSKGEKTLTKKRREKNIIEK